MKKYIKIRVILFKNKKHMFKLASEGLMCLLQEKEFDPS